MPGFKPRPDIAFRNIRIAIVRLTNASTTQQQHEVIKGLLNGLAQIEPLWIKHKPRPEPVPVSPPAVLTPEEKEDKAYNMGYYAYPSYRNTFLEDSLEYADYDRGFAHATEDHTATNPEG
jgi:hypothetical protein